MRRLKPPFGSPRLYLFSDPIRLPDPRAAMERLPPGAVVVARSLAPAMLRDVAAQARRRRLILLVAGDGRLALRFAAGLHLPDRRMATGLLPFLLARHRRRSLMLTVAAHGWAGLARGRRLRADAVVLSPIFATLSHPGAKPLGASRWAALAARAGRRPVVALGGIGPHSVSRVPRRAGGLAAIGGLAAL
ncbi:MAG: thiamine phosphate synthase [Belnapia sp.]|nr:thiamine phosphate synthase [Belnapia sp.]